MNLPYEVNDAELRKSFFREILPELLDALEEQENPRWGNMSAQHMVEHLAYSFQVSTGKLSLECKTPEEKQAKLQAFLNTNRPMPRGFVNPVTGAELPGLKHQNFEKAKSTLKKEIRHFLDYYKDNPVAVHTNPVFGELGAEQWQKFHFKHCYHHLSQFGLIAEETNSGY